MIEERYTEYTHQDLLPFTFKDKQGTPFNAKADLLINDLYIELKESTLNTKTSVKSSLNALRTQYKWRFNAPPDENMNHNLLSSLLWSAGYRKDCLDHAWNHSACKHQIVSNTLAEHDIDYLIVFSKHDQLVEHNGKMLHFKDYYRRKYNLTVMLESEFKDLLASLKTA